MLMYHADTGTTCVSRRPIPGGPAQSLNGPAIRSDQTKRDAHQRCLACAIFAEQCVDRARANGNARIVQGGRAAKFLCNPAHDQRRR
jgi:hypothetical protein